MIRIQAYDECFDCDWFANPVKCSEYETCRNCPNGKGSDCACCDKNLRTKKGVHISRRDKMKNIVGTINNFKIGNRKYSVSGYTAHLGYEDIILMST